MNNAMALIAMDGATGGFRGPVHLPRSLASHAPVGASARMAPRPPHAAAAAGIFSAGPGGCRFR